MYISKTFHFGFACCKKTPRRLVYFTRNYGRNINDALKKLDYDVNRDGSVNVANILKRLESFDPGWPLKLEGQKTLSSVASGLLRRKNYKELNLLVKCLTDINFEMWGGLSTVVLYSYIEQKNWNNAILLFEGMKRRKHIKHLRTYYQLVTSLSQDDQLSLAYRYFVEFEAEELLLATSRLKRPSDEMITTLLKSSLRFTRQNTFNASDRESAPFDSTLLINAVLMYMQKWGLLTSEVKNLLVKWFELQEKYTVTSTFINDDFRCRSCGANLSPGTYENLCSDIVSFIRKEMIRTGKCEDVDYLDKLFSKHHAFDVVIDTANILFRGKKNSKQFFPVALEKILVNMSNQYTKPFNKIALVLPQSFSNTEKMAKFIQDIAHRHVFETEYSLISLKRTNDDLVLLYIAALSELNTRHKTKDIAIISNDKFIDHRFICKTENQNDFFRWLRHRQKYFDNDGNVNLEGIMEPVVKTNKFLHLISMHNVYCVKQK